MKNTPASRSSHRIYTLGRPRGEMRMVLSTFEVPGVVTAKIINRDVYTRALARADAAIRQANLRSK